VNCRKREENAEKHYFFPFEIYNVSFIFSLPKEKVLALAPSSSSIPIYYSIYFEIFLLISCPENIWGI